MVAKVTVDIELYRDTVIWKVLNMEYIYASMKIESFLNAVYICGYINTTLSVQLHFDW